MRKLVRQQTSRLFRVVIMDPPWKLTGVKLGYELLKDEEILSMAIEDIQQEGWLFLLFC